MAKTLQELSGTELTTLSSAEILDMLGGLGEFQIHKDGFYTQAFKDDVDSQPTFPLMIPTPERWRAPFPYKVSMQVNGMTVEVEADKIVMVPRVFFEVWMQHLDGETKLRQARANAAARLNYNNSRSEVPDY